jgi:structural maintenance of chromosome 1
MTEQLNFERSRDTSGPRAKAEADIAKHEAELQRLTAAAAAAKQEAEASRGTLEGWERDAAAAKQEAEAVDAEVKVGRCRLTLSNLC